MHKFEYFADDILDHRTGGETQRKIVNQNGRNPIPRLVHMKNSGEMIVARKADLNRILHAIHVCSVTFLLAQLLLTILFQTELAMSTCVTISNIHHIYQRSRRRLVVNFSR